MRRSTDSVIFAIAGALLLLAQGAPARATWTHDPSSNLPVCVVPRDQFNEASAPDGAGGVFIVWEDYRNQIITGVDLFLQHVTKSGAVDPLWPASGLPIVTLVGDQKSPVAISDGAGGVIVVWQDHRGANWDIYAQRISAAGAVVAPWPANGFGLSVLSNDDQFPVIAPDGAGGAYVAWTRSFLRPDVDPMLQHVLENGSIAPGFPANGIDPDAANAIQNSPSIAADDSGGVWVAYQTNSSGNYDIRAARVLVNGGSAVWNVKVSAAAGDQQTPLTAADGHHGLLVAWKDLRGGNEDIYGSHVLANGLIGPGYNVFTDGAVLVATAGSEIAKSIVPDGAGGFYLYWSACSVLCAGQVTRIGPGGALAPGWPSSIVIGEATVGLAATSDGAGGSIAAIAGVDASATGYYVGAMRVTPGGSIATGWASPSIVCNAGSQNYSPTLVTDGNGGAIVAWGDRRGLLDADIYAQRIERYGQLGSPEPVISGVKDIPVDQGGQLRVSWNASYLDADPIDGVYQYRIWRQAPAAIAQQALARGAVLIDGRTLGRPGARVFRTSVLGNQTFYWELAGTQIAGLHPSYSFVAATTSDSNGTGNPRTVVMVDAIGSPSGAPYWSSDPDSGYSVDNLAPVAPAPFSATFSPPNGTFLAWGANGESDLAGYRLYRGGGLNFVPTPLNRIYDGPVPSYQDGVNTAYIYKVCAYDIHGNEGGCSTAQPPGTAAVESEVPRVLTLAPVDPNPAREGANLRFGLPRDGRVVVAIYDAAGRRVRTVIDAWLPAGVGLTRWDGRDAAGDQVGSGVYFVRLESAGARLTRRFVTLH